LGAFLLGAFGTNKKIKNWVPAAQTRKVPIGITIPKVVGTFVIDSASSQYYSYMLFSRMGQKCQGIDYLTTKDMC